jgi:hypothetical protein
LVAREGLQAPGAPPGAVFDNLSTSFEAPVLNNRGHVAFTGQLRRDFGGVTVANNYGIWSGEPGAMTLVAREGADAPGVPGATFRHFDAPQLNDGGQILFHALLVEGSGGVAADNDASMWIYRNGALELAAREGSQVPGASPGTSYGSFNYYAMNNQGRAAVKGYLELGGAGVTLDNSAAVWSGPAGALRQVAREGEPAPGAVDGAVFFEFGAPSINAAGQVAFLAVLKSDVGAVTPQNDQGLWATDASGVLHLIAREGDLMEIAPGDLQPITQLYFGGNTGNSDGRRSMFNDRGEVQFWAQVGSGEGIFISELVKNQPAAADFDGDGEVDGDDLAAWKTGPGAAGAATHSQGDADGDMDVDGADFLTWQRQLGGGATGLAITGAAIPEPAAIAMLLSGASALLARKRAAHR